MTRLARFRPLAAMIFIAVIQVGTTLATQSAQAQTLTIFDRTFTRETGAPRAEVVNFSAPAPGVYAVQIETGGVSSAVIQLNGPLPNRFVFDIGVPRTDPRDIHNGSGLISAKEPLSKYSVAKLNFNIHSMIK